MDAPARSRADRFAGAVDVLVRRAGEPADDRALAALGDLVDGEEIALRGDGESGLDDIDAQVVEHFGDLKLLLMGHGRAGRLLAVAQGGVENDDAVLFGLSGRGHGKVLLLILRPMCGRSSGPSRRSPLSALAQIARPALRGW